MSGQLQVESNVDQGTKFILNLKYPLERNREVVSSADRKVIQMTSSMEDEVEEASIPLPLIGSQPIPSVSLQEPVSVSGSRAKLPENTPLSASLSVLYAEVFIYY